MAVTPVPAHVSPARYPRQASLIKALRRALVLSERIRTTTSADPDDLDGLQWECMEAWSAVMTLTAAAARNALPASLREFL